MTRRPLIEVQELADVLGRVTLLDVRWSLGGPPGHEEFLRGHLPGASYVDLATDLADPPGERGRHPLPDPDRFGAAMRRCGVDGDRPVVAYDDVSGTSASRAWWLLRHHGHRDVRLLDGGYSSWVRAGLPVQHGPGVPPPGDFRPVPGAMPVLDADGAARVAREGVLVDARAAERFCGEVEPVDPVAGHIPGAVNVPAADNLVAAEEPSRGRFRSVEDLADGYLRRAGVGTAGEVGVYCGSGVTATHDVLALEVLGVTAALYPGSWSEWVTDPTRPVATGA
ncbi:MAG TPA: sulfurtransferase [Nocardioidaceae bacterium]|nr:sulfurtransferase [Nocardioidaceae bacterium]